MLRVGRRHRRRRRHRLHCMMIRMKRDEYAIANTRNGVSMRSQPAMVTRIEHNSFTCRKTSETIIVNYYLFDPASRRDQWPVCARNTQQFSRHFLHFNLKLLPHHKLCPFRNDNVFFSFAARLLLPFTHGPHKSIYKIVGLHVARRCVCVRARGYRVRREWLARFWCVRLKTRFR